MDYRYRPQGIYPELKNSPNPGTPNDRPHPGTPTNRPENNGQNNRPNPGNPNNKPGNNGSDNRPNLGIPNNRPTNNGQNNRPNPGNSNNKPGNNGQNNRPNQGNSNNRPWNNGQSYRPGMQNIQAPGNMPTMAPPTNPPVRNNQMVRVDAASIRNCIYHFTYIWLKSGEEFWMFPTGINRSTITGFRWHKNYGWGFYGTELDQVASFMCR